MKKFFNILLFLFIVFSIPYLIFYTLGLLAAFVAWDISLFTSILFSGSLNRLLLLLGLLLVGIGIAELEPKEVIFK